MALRCPGCRSRRATLTSLIAHVQASGHRVCGCGGYPWPHRPGSRYCEKNAFSIIHLAARYGDVSPEAEAEMRVDIAFHNTAGRKAVFNEPPPF